MDSFGNIYASKDLGPDAFLLFPLGQRFADDLFFASEPARLDRLTDKSPLVCRKLYVHVRHCRES
jgi:hypothetical protein